MSIPSESKAFIDTIGQIFNKCGSGSGTYRDILLDFISTHADETDMQKKYIDTQYDLVLSSSIAYPDRKFHRSVTHMRSVIQINISIHYTKIGDIFYIMWSIDGPDLQETFRFLPKMVNIDGSLSFPLKGTHHSRFYYMHKNYQIFSRLSLELRMLQIYISTHHSKIIPRSIDTKNTKDGVLNLDIYVDFSLINNYDKKFGSKFMDLISIFNHNKGNPYKVCDGVYIYNKNGTSTDIIDLIFSSKEHRLPNIFNTCIDISYDIDTVKSLMTHMINDYMMGLMIVNRHMMFWIKSSDTWYLCDPWKKTFRYVPDFFDEIFSSNKSKWKFLSRSYNEQHKFEGSCVIASLSRLVQISIKYAHKELCTESFHNIVNEPIEDWSALLASCLVRKNLIY